MVSVGFRSFRRLKGLKRLKRFRVSKVIARRGDNATRGSASIRMVVSFT